MRVVGAFTGIGGLETGLKQAGFSTVATAEIDPHASAVLANRLPETINLGDVTAIEEFPDCDLIAAGFPCQDLSQAGRMGGIHGPRSGLVRHIFDAVSRMSVLPEFLLFENVPFLLNLHGGVGIAWLLRQVEQAGYRWAYRIIDSRAFGLPHRRRRLFVLASRNMPPEQILFDVGRHEPTVAPNAQTPCGFYWTEGNRGLGWAVDAIPPLKSTALVVSAPAIWRPPSRDFVTPTIEDAEALQGFDRGWTAAASDLIGGSTARWRLVGNAVSVPAAKWVGSRILEQRSWKSVSGGIQLRPGQRWPKSAYGAFGRCFIVDDNEWPGQEPLGSLDDYLSDDLPRLSVRAAAGFLGRLNRSTLKSPSRFRNDLKEFIRNK